MYQIDFNFYQAEARKLINERRSFEICNIAVADMLAVSQDLENYMESQYLKCRIYTKNRIVTGLSGFLNPAWGILSLVSIAAHNLVTYDPDYEIGRDIANNRIEVIWKK
ncbi:hypothetical protein [Mesocricetibacter intestinalis]|uniref:hypothetical protein n=1 Tax=Mesocricetibacter intestinalis TaxID=1521930 RepID=UPI00105C564A|nr:hypothetical protein [Mesocricetibacter intestinalis]